MSYVLSPMYFSRQMLVPVFEANDWPLVESTLARRVSIPVEGLIVGSHHHALDIEVVVEAFGAKFAPDAAIADAAPGRGRIEPVMIVNPNDTGLDGCSKTMRAGDIAGANRGGKPEWRVIGEPQGVRFISETR